MNRPGKIGYVVKRYPRFSETFIVNEILAHEAAGRSLEIFSLAPCIDTHFQNAISLVRAPVNYLPPEAPKSADLWRTLQQAGAELPAGWASLGCVRGENIRELHQAVSLALLVRQKGIAHLHAHFATSPTTVTRLAARFAGISHSFTAHAKDIFHQTIDRDELTAKLRDAGAVITVSDFNVAYLQDQFGNNAQSVVRLFNGLDLGVFPYSAPLKRQPRIVAIGRLVEKKGFHVLIAACRELARRGVDFSCVIAGAGELEQGLAEQINAARLRDHVQLLGARPLREIIELVQSAAVLAAPCVVGADGNRDGLPTVLLEAMALGTPCVSTAVTGIPEVIRHDETGLLTPEKDPVALAAALERLLRDADLCIRLANAARKRIEADFDISRNAAEQRRIFDCCIVQHRDRVSRLSDAEVALT